MPTIVFADDPAQYDSYAMRYETASDESPFMDEEENGGASRDALSHATSTEFDSSHFEDEHEEKEAILVAQRDTKRLERRLMVLMAVACCFFLLTGIITTTVVLVKRSQDNSNKSSSSKTAEAEVFTLAPVTATTATKPPVVATTAEPVTAAPVSMPTDPVSSPITAPVSVPLNEPTGPILEEEEKEEQEEEEEQLDEEQKEEEEESEQTGDELDPEDLLLPVQEMSTVPAFSADILEPYATREELEEGLTAAAEDFVRKILQDNVRLAQEIVALSEEPYGLKDAATSSGKKTRINNMEADVKEGDSVQEDGTYVYAAYGDYLVVWNRHDGSLVTQEQMPTPPLNAYGYSNNPWIQAVQITENHVLAFAGGYGIYDYYYPMMQHGPNGGPNEPMVTWGNNETKLLVYTKPTPEEPFMTLVATQSLNGQYLSSRYLQETNTFHIVTGSEINAAGNLADMLSIWYFYPTGQNVNITEYYEHASEIAKDKLIPDFVTRLTDELMENNQGRLPNVLQVNNWELPDDRRRMMSMVYPGLGVGSEPIKAYIQVLTLNPDNLPTDTFIQEDLKMDSTVVLGPSPYSTVHAQGDNLVMTMERFDWDEEAQMTDESLFLLQLKVKTGGSTSFHSVASMPGRLAGKYSMDIEGNDLRIATTDQTYFPFDAVYQQCGFPPMYHAYRRRLSRPTMYQSPDMDACMTFDAWTKCHDAIMDGCANVTKAEGDCPYTFTCDGESALGSSTENYVVAFSFPTEAGNMEELGKVRIGNDHETIRSIHFTKDFSYAMTSNYGDKGPFYVLNLDEGQPPSIAYKLEPQHSPTGDDIVASTYLQPLNAEGSLLVGIGQNSTGNSIFRQDNGVAVTIFEVSDGEAPVVLASQMLNSGSNKDDYTNPMSMAEFDAKAVQYTEDGLLIIPMTMHPVYNLDSPDYDAYFETAVNASQYGEYLPMPELPPAFEGFVVLDVSNVQQEGIKEVFRINHSNPSGTCNYCHGYLPNHRSIWYDDDGSLMTMLNHFVASTDLDTLTRNWALNITIPGGNNNCCF